jgi:prohibitin 1
MMNRVLNGLVYSGAAFIAGGVLFSFCTFVVDGGEIALMFDAVTGSGVSHKTLGEGLHFRIPKLYEPIIYSIRMNPHVIETKTPARDLQLINISVRILERPDVQFLTKLYLDQRQNYAERVLPSITHEIIKAVVARYNPDQLITQREKVSNEIKQGLVSKAKEFNIILDDVAIIHIEFSKEYRDAIEAKQVSQQMAERAKFIVQKSEEERKLTIIKAEAESDSAKIFNEAIENYGRAFLELKRLEAAREIVDNLSKAKNVIYLPSVGQGGQAGVGSSPNFLYKI